ncbi:MAG: hypothetical protein GX234_04910 [Clostridiales bacterium]|nr:hypothetical protein [Clostridiales bacterium]
MSQVKNFAWPVTSVNREDYDALMQCVNNHRAELSTIVIFGAGIRGTEFSVILKKCGYKDIYFVDNNPQKWGGRIHEFPIMSPDELCKRRTEIKIIISTEHSSEIEKQLSEMGFVAEKDFYTVKSDLYEKYMNEFRRNYSGNVLLLADCEFSKIALKDSNTRNLAEMLKDRVNKNDLKILAMHGMGLRAYYNIFKSQITLGMKPKLLVVMVNFDTLTPKQYLLPRSQHAELIQMVYEETPVKDEELEEYRSIVWERIKNLQTEFSIASNCNEEIAILNRNKIYLKMNYLYSLNTELEGVQYLVKILRLAKKEGVKVVPYIPAINYMLGEELLGEQFTTRYQKNVSKIRMITEDENVELFDMSYLLSKDFFSDKDSPDETINERGRERLAELFATKIEEALK